MSEQVILNTIKYIPKTHEYYLVINLIFIFLFCPSSLFDKNLETKILCENNVPNNFFFFLFVK